MGNIEFIAANNLPVTEAEEVDVLCVVDGELKRKPAEGLGGAGSYLLKLNMDNAEVTGNSSNSVMIEYKDSFDDFAEHVFNGGSMVVDVTGLVGTPAVFAISGAMFMGEGELMLLGGISGVLVVQITCKNGTWLPPVIETPAE